MPRYDAFVSYSHAIDGRLAPAVQQALHKLAKPWYRMRALRVFRDGLSLSANPDLWSSITAALENSRYFVLMASPDSAESPWVEQEVEYWQQHREPETLLIVLTDGTIAWNHVANDFDWECTTALPRRLGGWFRSEPLWVPLGWARNDDHLSVRNPRFRDSLATLAAPMHGKLKEDLDSEDIRHHRLTTRVRNGAIITVVTFGLVAAQQAYLAEQRADEAQAALERAVSGDLVGRSQAVGNTTPAVSKLLSVAAWRLNPGPAARGAMVAAVDRPGAGVFRDSGSPALSPDGRIMASGSSDGTVRFWDTATRRPVGAPLTGAGTLGSLKFSPDGRTLVTGNAEGNVQLWDVTARKPISHAVHAHAGKVVATAFSRDGHFATAGLNGTVRLWDSRGTQIGSTMDGYETGTVTFSPDGRTLAFYGTGGVRLWDTATQRPVGAPMTESVGAVRGIAFSPDGSMLATGGYDGTIRLWNTATQRLVGEPIPGFRGGLTSGGVRALAFSSDGAAVAAVGSDGSVRLWDVQSRQQLGDDLTGHATATGAAFSADGETLVVSEDGFQRVWDLEGRSERGVPVGNFTSAAKSSTISTSTAISPDGRSVAIGSSGGEVRLWDIATRRQIGGPYFHNPGASVKRILFSRDGSRIALSNDETLTANATVWDLRTHKQVGAMLPESSPLSFESRNAVVTQTPGQVLQVWNPDTRQKRRLTIPDEVMSTAVSPDGHVVATGSRNNFVRLWDVARDVPISGALRSGFGAHAPKMDFSPDGRVLAVGSTDGTVRLWDTVSRRQIGEPLVALDPIATVKFSPDGATLATATDHEVLLWDTASRTPIRTPLSHNGESPQSLSFSPDSRMLATSTGRPSPAVRLWNLPSRRHLDAALCREAGRSLTPAEWRRYVPSELPYREMCP